MKTRGESTTIYTRMFMAAAITNPGKKTSVFMHIAIVARTGDQI